MENKVWKYCRQASPDGSLAGLQAQSHQIDNYITEHAYSLVGKTNVVESGIALDRESLRELIQLAKEGQYDILAVSNIDRLARNIEVRIAFCQKMIDLGIRIVEVNTDTKITENNFS